MFRFSLGFGFEPGKVCWIEEAGTRRLTALGPVTGRPAVVSLFDGTELPRGSVLRQRISKADLVQEIEARCVQDLRRAATMQAEYPHLNLTTIIKPEGGYRLIKPAGVPAFGATVSSYRWDLTPVQLYGPCMPGHVFLGHDDAYRADLFLTPTGALRAVYSTVRGDYDEANDGLRNPVLRRAAVAARRFGSYDR